MSVKECMDELPVGICFYWDGGLTKLTNRRMNSIACKLTGSGIMDADEFQKIVFSGKEAPILRTEDGAALSFVHREDTLDGRTIHELLAFDVTREYRLTEELREKQKKVLNINKRLKASSAFTVSGFLFFLLPMIRIRLAKLSGQSSCSASSL